MKLLFIDVPVDELPSVSRQIRKYMRRQKVLAGSKLLRGVRTVRLVVKVPR